MLCLGLGLSFSSAQAPIRLLFWGGTATGTHNARALRDTLAPVFLANNIAMSYRETASHSWLNTDSLSAYDVALLYTTDQTGSDLSAAQLNAFKDWIESGRVVVALHGSTNTYLNNGAISMAWRQLLGAQFLDHDTPNNCGTIIFTLPGHAALQGTTVLPPCGASSGSPPFWDEGRRHQLFTSDTVVLARAQLGTSNVPWIWVRPQGQGWVYYNASGHNGQVWTRPEWQSQVLRVIQWGGQVKTTRVRGPDALQPLLLAPQLRLDGARLFIPLQEAHSAYSLGVFDMAGRRLFFHSRSKRATWDLSFLPAGTYGVRMLSETGERLQGQFILNRSSK